MICVKCWKENLPVDTSRLLDLVLHNARVGSTVVDDFVKTCINELEVFVVSDIDHTASLPVQQFQTMTVNPESSTALKQGFKKLSRPGVVEMLVAMEKISNSGHATTTSLYALHLDLEFYESLGQEILKGLEEEAENMREHNLEKYLDVFRLHVEYISKSPPTTKSADFIDIFQILLQASIQSLFTNINSPLVPLCLDIAVTLVDNDLLKLDELDTQRLRQSIGGSDPYLCLVISKLIKTPIDGRTMSELVNSSKPEYVKAVLGYIDVEVLVGYHRRKDDGDGNAVVEMAREFRNVVKDLKRKHQVEIDEVKGAFLAEEVMEEVQRVCGENLELRAKSGELESKFGGLEANVQGLEKEVEKARAVNAGLDMAMKKCESENAELIKKVISYFL